MAERLSRELGTPFICVTTGTDIDPGLRDEDVRATVLATMRAAAAVAVQHEGHRQLLRESFGDEIGEKTFVVTPSVQVTADTGNIDAFRSSLGLPSDQKLALHISGIREVKGTLEATQLMDALHQRAPTLRYLLVGKVLEEEYAQPILQWIRARDWATHVDRLSAEDLAAAYAAADLSLCTSHAEGMSNALLESMAGGAPVLASDILSNRALIEPGRTGELYTDASEFVELGALLLDDPEYSLRMRHAARDYVETSHSPAQEQQQLVSLCQHVLADA